MDIRDGLLSSSNNGEDSQIRVSDVELSEWQSLYDAADLEIRDLSEKIARARARQRTKLTIERTNLTNAVSTSKEVLGELHSLVSEATNLANKDTGNVLASMVTAMNKAKINVQVYWKGSLVGPDCRRFLKEHRVILDAIVCAMREESYAEDQCAAFREYHTRILTQLDKIGALSRKVTMLTDSEIEELSHACETYGAAARASVPDCLPLPKSLVRTRLTPKGHVVEVHLAAFARRYGTIGFFGEDGIEALHPKDTKCRQLTRCIRNPEARGLATTRHLTRIQCGKGVADSQFHRNKRPRVT